MLFVFISVFCQSVSVLFMKYAALSTTSNFFINKYILFAIITLFLQSLFWQIALRKYNLSHIYFYMSLRYIFTMSFGYFLFSEQINVLNIIGLIIIIIGISYFSKSEKLNA